MVGNNYDDSFEITDSYYPWIFAALQNTGQKLAAGDENAQEPRQLSLSR
jgi:hypothetical protein